MSNLNIPYLDIEGDSTLAIHAANNGVLVNCKIAYIMQQVGNLISKYYYQPYI